MRLGDLLTGLDVSTPAAGWESVRICDLTEDSRTVVPGSLFVARRGAKADGRKFVADAVGAGAVAVLTDETAALDAGVPVVVVPDVAVASARLAERFYGNPSARLGAIAVTGTNGKTTTTYLIWQLLNALGIRCGLIGTVIIDDGTTVAPATMTTPPAFETSRTLSLMVEAGCQAVALEASSHALDQRRLDGLVIRVGIFTNLTGDHLDYHGDMETYGAAKARLFSLLAPGGTAVINADDPAGARVAAHAAQQLTCTVRGDPRAACCAEILSTSMAGTELRMRGPWGTIQSRVALIGRYNAMNALQAVCAIHALSDQPGSGLSAITADRLAQALATVSAPPGRLEPVLAEPKRRASTKGRPAARAPSLAHDGPSVFVDYAHSDDALRNVLTSVREAMGTDGGRLWVVFGCGGDKDRTKRPRMGLAASELADRVVVTSDNPRSERPAAIVDEILAGVPAELRGKVEVHVERGPAIRHAIESAHPGDVVLIAGKGHETEQVLAGEGGAPVRHHFDDREIAQRALMEFGPRHAAHSAGVQ